MTQSEYLVALYRIERKAGKTNHSFNAWLTSGKDAFSAHEANEILKEIEEQI